jgi:cyclopropane fatty-acyl-phospholipid synthase-like methyltransferase
MDRTAWLREKRQEAEERYSTLWAPLYWEEFGLYANKTHQQFIREFIKLLPQNSVVLDAASGAGRYLPFLLERGFTIVATDQAEGMLARAKEKFPGVQFEKVGLQELSYREAFDGATCMDAMEHVSPEDWPVVLGNFHRALKPQGYLYFTVEVIEEAELKAAFARGQQLGWPLVYGELADEEVYHYYPSIEQVREWLQQAGFALQQEGEGDLYHHFIVRNQ